MAENTAAHQPYEWVTKTDLTRYLACPQGFYLLDSGRVKWPDLDTVASPADKAEDIGSPAIDANARKPIPAGLKERLARLLRGSIDPFKVNERVFDNFPLKIRGQPFAIDAAEGALFPAIRGPKGDMDIKHSNKVELAFYWMLLAPHRTRVAEARGYVLHAGKAGPVEAVELAGYFDEVHRLLPKIRDARRHGIAPRVCNCNVCVHLASELHRAALKGKHISLIRDVGPARIAALEEGGINTYEQLLAMETAAIVVMLRQGNCGVSQNQVQRWKQHAMSYANGAPSICGEVIPIGESL